MDEHEQRMHDAKVINQFAMETWHMHRRYVSEAVVLGKQYEWWKRLDTGQLILVGPVVHHASR